MGTGTHSIFTVIAPVRPGKQDDLRAWLESRDYLGRKPDSDPLGFERLPMLHYASMFLYEDEEDGWLFVFESNIDGYSDGYLEHLVTVALGDPAASSAWTDIFSHCEGFSGNDLWALRNYMIAHIQRPAAAFVAGVGLSRDRIRKDAAIHRVVDRVLGSGVPKMSGIEAQAAVLEALRTEPETRDFTDRSGDYGHGPGVIGGLWAAFSAVISAAPLLVLLPINLISERLAAEENRRPDENAVRAQKLYEDHTPTNHMASIVYLHRDLARHFAKRAVFGLLNALVSLIFHRGHLGGIASIHFAHWAFVSRRRRLLFVSNFDGSWDSYLNDFTLKANHGLTAAWAHSIGIPRSTFMYWGGAAKGPQFIDWARRSMVPCPVWYNAYPGLSVQHIVRNRELGRALAAAATGRGGSEWLHYV